MYKKHFEPITGIIS